MTRQGKIRPLAIGIIRRDDCLFVAEGADPAKKEIFYRPLGGGIKFGEYGHQALAREFREELGAEIETVRFLGVIENIFIYRDEKGHEIILLYEAKFVDKTFYTKARVIGREDGDQSFKALWKSLNDFRDGKAILYPSGLLDILLNPLDKT